jgi:hypothetical protein
VTRLSGTSTEVNNPRPAALHRVPRIFTPENDSSDILTDVLVLLPNAAACDIAFIPGGTRPKSIVQTEQVGRCLVNQYVCRR